MNTIQNMDVSIAPGKYILAVSGGIDSVVLLHLLHNNPGVELTVAHFDHGIRKDASEDTAFVAGLAGQYELDFVSGAAELGPDASEDTARRHRYAFLREACDDRGGIAVITAHHQDDVIETALMNVQRGTKRRGLVSLRSTDSIKRPLLAFTKDQIREYAVFHGLEWVEDSTNSDMKYGRNRVRAQLYRHLTIKKRDKIAELLAIIEGYNQQIDVLVNEFLMKYEKSLPKEKITTLKEQVAAEIIAGWLRSNQVNFDKKTIGRIYEGGKTLRNGSQIDIDKHHYCLLTKEEIVLKWRESV